MKRSSVIIGLICVFGYIFIQFVQIGNSGFNDFSICVSYIALILSTILSVLLLPRVGIGERVFVRLFNKLLCLNGARQAALLKKHKKILAPITRNISTIGFAISFAIVVAFLFVVIPVAIKAAIKTTTESFFQQSLSSPSLGSILIMVVVLSSFWIRRLSEICQSVIDVQLKSLGCLDMCSRASRKQSDNADLFNQQQEKPMEVSLL